jgi:hypothetical protein
VVTNTVVRLPTGQLRVSRIVYFTDLLHADTREIPIGVVAEVTLPSLRGIGTALRPSLGEHDAALMGPAARKMLADPMAALWPAMTQALATTTAGRALDELCSHYASSISIMQPTPLDVPRQWLMETDQAKLTDLVRARMLVALTDEYWRFLFPPRADVVSDPPETNEEITKAAA